jgi:hypothetical protein
MVGLSMQSENGFQAAEGTHDDLALATHTPALIWISPLSPLMSLFDSESSLGF